MKTSSSFADFTITLTDSAIGEMFEFGMAKNHTAKSSGRRTNGIVRSLVSSFRTVNQGKHTLCQFLWVSLVGLRERQSAEIVTSAWHPQDSPSAEYLIRNLI